jgi:uncharacterized protein YndB with AHSA1/START domain
MPAEFRQLSDREVVFTRLLDAPRPVVWEAWTDPRFLHEWWGPDGFTTTTHEFAFVPGGTWRFTMHGPDGIDTPNRIVFREIEAPSRLVYENGWGRAGAPLDFEVVVTLAPIGDQTRLSLHMTFRDAASLRTAVEYYGVLPGGVQILDRLAVYLRA